MSGASFPFASSRFTIKRPGQVVQDGYNHVLQANAVISTGVAIMVRDLNGVFDAVKGGVFEQGMYRGSCSKSVDVQGGDLLMDEANKESDGSNVQYQVTQVTVYPWLKKLHLHRTVAGT